MQIVEYLQGTPEWRAYRINHFNASDAPAMMGVSPYKTRNQLLCELSTGLIQEFDAATQYRLNEGHRHEALARPLAEEIIGEELYPVTGHIGELSASFDGLTMDGKICFEHKTLNDSLRVITSGDSKDLPLHYRIQMEQQLLVSNAEKCLFMATKWNGNELVERPFVWYESDSALREKIIAGWEQFKKDLATYVPVDPIEKPKASAIMTLPALAIQIKGEVTLSNLPEFKQAAEAFIANIKTDLNTDEDFANAEETVKFCKKAEEVLEVTKNSAIAQTASIDELMRTIDFIKAQLRDKRLSLDKLVSTKKESLKCEIINKYQNLFRDHVTALEKEIYPISLSGISADFASAMKNKRTLASLYESVDLVLANSKIEADALSRDIRAKQAWLRSNAEGYEFLFADLQQIIYKPSEDFEVLVKSRLEKHRAVAKAKIETELALAKAKEEADKNHVTGEQGQAAISLIENTLDEMLVKPFIEASRPSNHAIIQCVATAFKVDLSTAINWLSEIDYESEKAA